MVARWPTDGSAADQPARAVSTARVVAPGALIGVAFVLLRRWSPADGSPLFFSILGMACVGYAMTMRALFRHQHPSRTVLLLALLLALGWRMPLAMAPVGQSADVYRYLWDARVQRAGQNPYAALPSDPALDWIHSPHTRRLNNPGVPSPYPPVAQWFFRVVTSLHESPEAMKLALVACEALLVVVLWHWLPLTGRHPSWVLAYAWHPLATLEIARNGHFDVLGALLVCLSALALGRRWQTTAATAFALAVGAKLLPVVLIPLYWKRVRPRDVAIAALVLAAATAPFVWGGVPRAGSIPNVVERFRFNAPVFAWAQSLVGPWGAAGLALAAGLATSCVCRRLDVTTTPAAWAWPLAIALACSPLVYPWYLLWVVPMLTTASGLPLLAWSLTILPTYGVWHWSKSGAPWRVPFGILVVEFGIPLVVAGYLVWTAPRRRTQLR